MIPAAHPVYANVAFLRIPELEARTVSEQASLKERLEARARRALARLPTADRVVLDAEEGLALVFFGNPGRALDLVQAIHGSGGDELQAGLNYGPLALSSRGGDARVFGDGLTAALAAARFAAPQRLLVTQDFRRALEALEPERAATLAPAGEFTDTRVRLHSFYTPDPKLAWARRRQLLSYGVAGVAAILALGIAAREARLHLFMPQPAVLKFVVKPRGEVFVDGISKGVSPPLHEIEIAPGKRVVQIRNAGFPPLEAALELMPGERRTLSHTFVRPPPPPRKPAPAPQKQQPPEPDFWQGLKNFFS